MKTVTFLILIWILSILGVREVSGGCYQKRLCCTGKNDNCTSSESSSFRASGTSTSSRRRDVSMEGKRNFLSYSSVASKFNVDQAKKI